MMKVLLVDPPMTTVGLNIGLAYLAAALVDHGYEVAVLDLNNSPAKAKPKAALKQKVMAFEPDLVGFSMLSRAYGAAIQLIRYLKTFSRVSIVVGGPHVFIAPGELAEDKDIDYCIIGEGEITLAELAKTLQNGADVSTVKGIIYKNGGRIIETEPRPLLKDLDRLPFPNYRVYGIREIKEYPLLTSRGCPYGCAFCLSPKLSQHRWRARNPEKLIDELVHAVETYRSTSFTIMDDNFTLDARRAEEFCDLLMQSGLKLKWWSDNGIRADKVTEGLALKMKQAGCAGVSLGVESFDPEVFDRVNKGETIEQIKKTIRLFRQHKIRVDGFLIVGLPGDTFAKTIKSQTIARQVGLNQGLTQLLVPYPKTDVWDYVVKSGRFLRDEKSSTTEVVFETEDFSGEERRLAYEISTVLNYSYAAFYVGDSVVRSMRTIPHLLSLILRYDLRNIWRHLFYLPKRGLGYIWRTRIGLTSKQRFERRLGIKFDY